jgi:actin related protein 2/3 complex subunit 3
LFKQFEMETDVDRVLVYVTLYTIECLKRLQKCSTKEQATRDMYTSALESFHLPGEAGFPLNAFYTKPKAGEVEELKKYLTQVTLFVICMKTTISPMF